MRTFGTTILIAVGMLAAISMMSAPLALAGGGGGVTPDYVVNLPQVGGEFWLRVNDSSWTPINSVEGPVSFVVGDLDGGSGVDDIMGSWGNTIVGMFVSSDGGQTYTQFSNNTAANLTLAQLDGDAAMEVVMGFSGVSAGIDGTWVRDNAADTWTKISNLVPDAIGAANVDGAGIDEVLLSYTSGDAGINGTYLFDFSGPTFTKISNFVAIQVAGGANLNDDAQGREDPVVIFNPSDILGTWAWVDNGGFQLLSSESAQTITTADLDGVAGDELVGSFTSAGGTFYMNLAGVNWTQFSNSIAGVMAGGDVDGTGTDDLILSFQAASPAGTWSWRNNSTFMVESNSPTSEIGFGELTGD